MFEIQRRIGDGWVGQVLFDGGKRNIVRSNVSDGRIVGRTRAFYIHRRPLLVDRSINAVHEGNGYRFESDRTVSDIYTVTFSNRAGEAKQAAACYPSLRQRMNRPLQLEWDRWSRRSLVQPERMWYRIQVLFSPLSLWDHWTLFTSRMIKLTRVVCWHLCQINTEGNVYVFLWFARFCPPIILSAVKGREVPAFYVLHDKQKCNSLSNISSIGSRLRNHG